MNTLFSAMTRRRFLYLSALSAAGLATSCATNPVTGESQLMLISERQEVDLDKKHSPHQFSADYGIVSDTALNQYLDQTGKRLAVRSHRPQMPYSFQVVNAAYVNAYAFPGGSIATTRGILLKLDNEAELAALLGHELGHVNARHTAEIMSKNIVTSTLVGGVAAYVGSKTQYGDMAAKLGMLGSGALLASYSRDNERQADALGVEYMVKGGYGPEGMVGLMDMLQSLSKGRLSAAQLLFSTHPMSTERYQTAVQTVDTTYAAAKGQPLHRERFMDHIAGLRRIRDAVEALQKGEAKIAKGDYAQAENNFKNALSQAPSDYAALLMMAKCLLAQKKINAAAPYLADARQVYPQEAQADYLSGYVNLKQKQYREALNAFNAYAKKLPGNPNITFFKGLSYEGMQQQKAAADHYHSYLKIVREGNNAQYAYKRLVEWGYIKQ